MSVYRRRVSPTAGYSSTSLPRKLGIKPGHRVLLERAPAGFTLDLPPDVTLHRRRGSTPYDVVLSFCPDADSYVGRIATLEACIVVDGALWIGWPKRSSSLASDIDENLIRDSALARGLVDVKVCAIDDTWSGLKLVWRKENRR